MNTDRYRHLDRHADVGLGADDPGIRRFTRASEVTDPDTTTTQRQDDAVTDIGTALHLTHRVLADITPHSITELLTLADLVVDASRGALTIVKAVTA